MKVLAALLAVTMLFSAALFAQANNPVPFVNQPLTPASVAPGGAAFTLNVSGTGFVSGSVVNWNGSPRATTFVSGSHLTAAILSTDIAAAATGSITVSSPKPGGGTSNVVFLPVRTPSTFVSMDTSSFGVGSLPNVGPLVVADLNKDGKQDMAVVPWTNSGTTNVVSIFLGNGDGTFSQGTQYGIGQFWGILSADVNNDGNLDLVVPAGNGQGVAVLLGNGDGTFQSPLVSQPNEQLYGGFALADFNGDGALDLLFVNDNSVCILPGKGDGTFQPEICNALPQISLNPAVGDFNGDGRLDVAVTNSVGNSDTIVILLGNGDGTFKQAETYQIGANLQALTTADLNGDGQLDLVAADGTDSRVLTLFGKGDGTFREGATYVTALGPLVVTTADMNGDGNLDLVVGDYGYYFASVSVLLGNGDGTFQPYSDYDAGTFGYSAIADFNDDGRLDLAVTNGTVGTVSILTQDNGSTASLSAKTLTFPTQLVNTVSDPQIVTLTNTGTSAIKVTNVSVSPNFSELTNCGTVQPGKTCKIGAFLTPTIPGSITGYMAITDNAGGSPQLLNLFGTGTVVSLSPASVNFGSVKVGALSAPQTVTVTNTGNGKVTLAGIGIGGANAKNFMEVNACPQQLPAGTSCNISVYFRPSAAGVRKGVLGVKTGMGNPQTVPLTGTGT